MGFFPAGTYDLFLTHHWNYTDAWQGLVALLDERLPGKWRNWSIPWHDTSIERYSADGKAQLEKLLHGHISMASAVIVLPETMSTTDGRMWLDKQLTISRHYSKPMIGVFPLDDGPFPEVLKDQVRVIVRRNAVEIIDAVDRLVQTSVS